MVNNQRSQSIPRKLSPGEVAEGTTHWSTRNIDGNARVTAEVRKKTEKAAQEVNKNAIPRFLVRASQD